MPTSRGCAIRRGPAPPSCGWRRIWCALPIVIPTYGWGMKSKLVLRLGMAAYDLLTLDRNRGIRELGTPHPERQFHRA